jgi:transposase
MDRRSLESFLGEGLSLAEIGRRVGLHESTVGYWVGRHGLEATNRQRHAARGGIPRERLEELLGMELSTREIAEILGCSLGTVRYWLARHGLAGRQPAGARSPQATRAARASGLSKVTLFCSRHGETIHYRDGRGYFRCRRCRQEAVVRRRRRAKEILVEEAGGCCVRCGYDRCVAALQFHHVDPRAKEFGVAEGGMARSIDRLRAEAAKCVLLCSNCHAEVESGAAPGFELRVAHDPG